LCRPSGTWFRVHVIFSTKERKKCDHVHALLALPPTLPLAKAIQFLKGSSSHWINESRAGYVRFAWQEGYGAFSVSASHTEDVVRYIRNQRQHHERKSFEDEFVGFLKKYGVAYDPAYVLG
jgi:REP element-mobilizing transposase RayT